MINKYNKNEIALILPANIQYSPYYDIYTELIKKTDVIFDTIFWNRLNLSDYGQDDNIFSINDNKRGFRRSFIDYRGFANKIKAIIQEKKYSKVIIFGYPLAYFLYKYLNRHKIKYVIDIRDLHNLMRVTSAKKVFKNAEEVVLSSPGFIEKLPRKTKYLISHNYSSTNHKNIRNNRKELIKISYIGTIRNDELMVKYLKEFSLKDGIVNNFFGTISERSPIIKLSRKYNGTINIYGTYSRDDENELYKKSDFINVILPKKNWNEKRLLPNRLYKAVAFNKPIITLKGTYLASVVESYKLGLVIENFKNISEKIKEYQKLMNQDEYQKNINKFFSKISEDEENFTETIKRFLTM